MGLGIWRHAKELKHGDIYLSTSLKTRVQTLFINDKGDNIEVAIITVEKGWGGDVPEGKKYILVYGRNDMVYCDN